MGEGGGDEGGDDPPDALTRAMGVRSEVGLDDGLSRTLDFRTPGPVLLT
jgi:hypothetical protein